MLCEIWASKPFPEGTFLGYVLAEPIHWQHYCDNCGDCLDCALNFSDECWDGDTHRWIHYVEDGFLFKEIREDESKIK